MYETRMGSDQANILKNRKKLSMATKSDLLLPKKIDPMEHDTNGMGPS